MVIPAYNASKSVGKVIKGLLDYGFKKMNIFLVDDGSKDETALVGEKMGVALIKLGKNYGKGFALQIGFQKALERGLNKIITIDADGQHNISDIDGFLRCMNQYDLIIGSRMVDTSGMPFLRRITNRITSLVISLLSNNYIPDVQSGYRLLDLKILESINLKTRNFQTESELVYKAIKYGYRVGFVPIKTIYGSQRSYIKPLIDTVRFINMTVRFLWG